MAEFKEKFFGKVSGKFGDFIGVIKGDENYLAKFSANRKIDNSEAGIKRRAKFKASILAAKTIMGIPNLKTVWKLKAPKKQSGYNYCIKYNYPNIDMDGTKAGYSIVPDYGFAFSTESFSITEDSISLTVLPLINSTAFDLSIEKSIEACFLVELNNPDGDISKKLAFTKLVSADQVLDLENNITFTVNLLETEKNLIASYPNTKVHIALITKNESGEPIQYSSSLIKS